MGNDTVLIEEVIGSISITIFYFLGFGLYLGFGCITPIMIYYFKRMYKSNKAHRESVNIILKDFNYDKIFEFKEVLIN